MSRSTSSERSEQSAAMMARLEARARTNQLDPATVHQQRHISPQFNNNNEENAQGDQSMVSVFLL